MAGNFDGAAAFTKAYPGRYYIHRNARRFYTTTNTPIEVFRQKRNELYDEMLNRYQEHFKVSVSKEVWQKIAEAMQGEEKEAEIIQTIENVILKQIKDKITDSQTLLEALNKAKNISYKDLIKEDNVEAVNDLITQIHNAVELLEEGEKSIGGPSLAAILNEFLQAAPENRDITKLKRRLGVKVGIMSKQKDSLTVEQDAIRSIANSLNGILKNSTSGKLRKKSLDSYLSNIFSTRIGEYIVSKGILVGAEDLSGAVKRSLVGAQNVKIEAEDLQMAEEFGQTGGTKYKTDNKFENFMIELDGEKKKEFNISLGISTKWYKGNLDKDPNFSVSLGGEKYFENKLNQTLHVANISKYYAYNAIALKNQNSKGYEALLQMILARNADVFVSGLGVGGDFSQFLVINGKFFSIYKILTELLEAGDIMTKGPIEVELTGKSELNAITNEVEKARKEYPPSWRKGFKRSRKINPMFKELGLSLHFYPNRLGK